MKSAKLTLLLITLLAFWTGSALQVHARCASSALWFSPASKSKKLPRNSQILVHLYGWKRSAMAGVFKHAVLVHRQHTVKLRVRPVPSSKHSKWMQYILLEPAELLHANATYVMQIRTTRPKSIYSGRWKQLNSYRFETSSVIDRKAPHGTPVIQGAKYTTFRFGCGPSRNIRFKVQGLKDEGSPSLRYLIDVSIKGTGKQYRILSAGPSFGHGMCSGNFAKWKAGVYTIAVTPVDLAGNKGKTSKTVQVKVP
jgi:hypothetical protein